MSRNIEIVENGTMNNSDEKNNTGLGGFNNYLSGIKFFFKFIHNKKF